jgi:ABC-type cobalamin/Fe3+-siderophores transport system ATPase subunit
MNRLFLQKSIAFDERNIPKIKLPTGEEVEISTLSSGEKQLFIILGEALLQENRNVVFISDEPELSLHVKWQGTLFENIRSINPSCQVITATHSPDIIGPYSKKVIKIEECFR